MYLQIIFNIYIKTGFVIKQPTMVDMSENQTKPHNEIYESDFSNCLYPTPPSRAGCDTRSVIKRITTGLNSEVSLTLTGCHFFKLKISVCRIIYT